MNRSLFANQCLLDTEYCPETPEREICEDAASFSLDLIFRLLQFLIAIISQILLLFEVSRMNGANALLVALLVQVIMVAKFSPKSFSSLCEWIPPNTFLCEAVRLIKPHLALLAYINNDGYKRAKSLDRFADGSFRQDIISNNLGKWITTGIRFSKALSQYSLLTIFLVEYRNAFAAVGDTSTEEVAHHYFNGTKSTLVGLFEGLLRGFPSVSHS